MVPKFMPAFRSATTCRRLRLVLALSACGLFASPFHAQTPASAGNRAASTWQASQDAARFGQPPFQPVSPWDGVGSPQTGPNPFQPTLGFESIDWPGAGGSRSGALGTDRFKVALRGLGGPLFPSAPGYGHRQADLDLLFPASAIAQGSAVSSEAPSGGTPSFNDLMRGNLNGRSASPFAPMRPAQKSFVSGAAFSDPFQPPLSALITSDLGSGVLFSAGANTGGHSMVGSPAAGFGPSTGGKHSGPSVGLKLSF